MKQALVNPYSLVSFTAAVLSLVLSGYALLRRRTPGSRPFAVLAVGIAIWTGSYGFRVVANDPEFYVVWMNVEWIGILLATTAWLRFALEYTGADGSVESGIRLGLPVPAVALLAGIWTNGVHGLFRQFSGTSTVVDGIVTYQYTYGPIYWIAIAYVNLLLLSGTVVVVNSIVTDSLSNRLRNVVLLAALALPWSAAVIDLAGLGPGYGLNLIPFALTASCLLFGWLLFPGDLLDALPLSPGVSRQVVFSELADGVVVLDMDDRIVECNPAARDLLPEERSIRGERISKAFPAVASVLSADETPTAERHVVLDGPDGTRYFEVRSSPIERGGTRPVGHLLTLHDIDDRILREQRLDVLNRILRHNVRNQMTVILGHNENVLHAVSDPDLVDQVETVERAGRRLLDWARRAGQVERTVGHGSGQRTRMDLVECVETVVARHEEEYPYATIFTYLPTAAPVVADRSIDEAIEELVINALTHSDRPRPTVRISVERDGETVELRVADDGPGIPADERRALASGEETPMDHASGLGLWLVNWLVRLSGGSLYFEENDPRGSVVRVRLPVASAVEDGAIGP